MPSRGATLLLKGGTLHDGSGGPPRKTDVLIEGGLVRALGPGLGADDTLDVTGLAVCPGFIDTHGHSEFSLLSDPSAEGKVLQGITTEINGNCGLSAAPLLGEALRQREAELRECGVREPWSGFPEYLEMLESRGLAMNFATLAGHGNIRASAMGYAHRRPEGGEMALMKRLLEESLEAGAMGLSTGLIYPPGLYAETGELVDLAAHGRGVLGDRFVYASHMRSEGRALLEAIEEAITIGRRAGVRVHISHIKTAGKEYWHKIERAVSIIEAARAEGVKVSCDRYPYTASSTDLDAVLPEWAFEGGNEEELRRLREPSERQRMKRQMEAEGRDWSAVVVCTVSSENNKWMEGMSVAEISSRLGKDPVDALMELLLEEELRVGAIFHNMSEDNLRRFLGLPFVMVGTDSSARSLSGPTARGRPHPRGFGSFPRFLSRYVEDLPSAIRKMTSLAAETFGLEGRGTIKKGFAADIVVFDPGGVADEATFEQPFLPPRGIRHVLVNGVPAVSLGRPTGRMGGRILRHGR